MKKLMILGAGYTQIPLFEAARRLGVSTVACSIAGNYEGFDHADEISYTDISDPEAVSAAAREFHADGVATCGLDLAMRAIGCACERNGLPGPSEEAARTVSDKYLMKKALTAGGVRTAAFEVLHTSDDLEAALSRFRFPVMLKAVDQMGGRGIFKCETPAEARDCFPLSLAASRKDYCLIEEFIDGPLFGVEGMLQNGRFVFLMPDNTAVFHAATDIPVGHSVPLENFDDRIADIEEQLTKAVAAVGLDNCPVNADCILHDGKTWIVELTGRSGATGLSEIVSLRYNLDYYEEIVKIALGEDVSGDFSGIPFSGGILTRTLTAPRKGILRRIVNSNLPSEEIIDLSFNIEPGDSIAPFTNGRDRIGQVILKCASSERCTELLASIERKIRLELTGDVPLETTPVEELFTDAQGNRVFMKREDKLSFSYGGNKVRFAYEYYADMIEKGCDAMILYGGYSSNLCRILAQLCYEKSIPCAMVYNTEDSDPNDITLNASLIRGCGVEEFRCTKGNIAEKVTAAMNYFLSLGKTPYYIHGDCYGRGNAATPMKSYADVYWEIKKQEAKLGVHFDGIFLAGSTNTSQAGLLAASLTDEDPVPVTGISVNRKNARAKEVMLDDLAEYAERFGVNYLRDPAGSILFTDEYLCGGYGSFDSEIEQTITEMYRKYGIGLDPTYTGKAFTGMLKYLKDHGIKNRTVLFIHTGGTPLFLDYAKKAGLKE